MIIRHSVFLTVNLSYLPYESLSTLARKLRAHIPRTIGLHKLRSRVPLILRAVRFDRDLHIRSALRACAGGGSGRLGCSRHIEERMKVS
jgi:hypothetical protein